MKQQLYYNDPLQAAYMAREFDVNLVYEEDVDRLPKTWHKTYGVNGFYTRSHHDIITSSLEVGNSRRQEIINKKFFVHPDSFGVFEPKVDDIIEHIHEDPRIVNDIHDCCFTLGVDYTKNVTIIQRSSKAFFMPNIT